MEGCGDHGLEYMTGGLVAILGPTGRNLAAGMSGGIAFVLDESHNLYKKVNKELVSMEDITTAHDKELLFRLINNHFKETGSKVAERILSNFDESLSNFKKIIPNDYKKMLEEIAKSEQKGSSHEEAVMEAFKIVTNTASSVA